MNRWFKFEPEVGNSNSERKREREKERKRENEKEKKRERERERDVVPRMFHIICPKRIKCFLSNWGIDLNNLLSKQ